MLTTAARSFRRKETKNKKTSASSSYKRRFKKTKLDVSKSIDPYHVIYFSTEYFVFCTASTPYKGVIARGTHVSLISQNHALFSKKLK